MSTDWNIQALLDFVETFLLDSQKQKQEAHSAILSEVLSERLSEPLSEYGLLKALTEAGLFDHLPKEDTSLLLFQKHFLCMHVLYLLQDTFLKRNFYLHIEALAIYLENAEPESASQQVTTANNELRNYYLDLQNLEQATSETVFKLQLDFNKRYTAWLNSDEAFAALELDAQANWKEVQRNYRRLANSTHPDKGGNAAQFHKVKLAYEQLKTRFK